MEKTFDAVLSVDELKRYKPAPEVYELDQPRKGACRSAGFPARPDRRWLE